LNNLLWPDKSERNDIEAVAPPHLLSEIKIEHIFRVAHLPRHQLFVLFPIKIQADQTNGLTLRTAYPRAVVGLGEVTPF
jgi:hypothetical protein